MLILSRKSGETLLINEEIEVKIGETETKISEYKQELANNANSSNVLQEEVKEAEAKETKKDKKLDKKELTAKIEELECEALPHWDCADGQYLVQNKYPYIASPDIV